MKMENLIIAPFDAQIVEICIKVNQMVEEGQLILYFSIWRKLHNWRIENNDVGKQAFV